MRIAIVNKYLHVTGGADRHCRGLAEILEERGHEVVFLTTEGTDAPDRAAVTIPTSVTHDSRAALSMAEQARAAARSLWNPDAAAAMRRLIAEYRPDVVHAHKLYPQLSVAPLVEAARARIPIVQTLHDFELIAASALDARGGWRDLDETPPALSPPQQLHASDPPSRLPAAGARVRVGLPLYRACLRGARHQLDGARRTSCRPRSARRGCPRSPNERASSSSAVFNPRKALPTCWRWRSASRRCR